MIRVLVVDDQPIVRKGFAATLAETDDIQVTGEAANGGDALVVFRRNEYDVIVLDMSLRGMNSLDVLKQMKLERPEVHVLALGVGPKYAVRCLKAGALGYLTKESAPAELVRAIRKVASGQKFINPDVAIQLADLIGPDATHQSHEGLSDREFQVLCLLGRGESIIEIANSLSLSKHTVYSYRSRLMAKMNIRSTAQLMLYVLENQLTDKS